jgi:hypothetical protein
MLPQEGQLVDVVEVEDVFAMDAGEPVIGSGIVGVLGGARGSVEGAGEGVVDAVGQPVRLAAVDDTCMLL